MTIVHCEIREYTCGDAIAVEPAYFHALEPGGPPWPAKHIAISPEGIPYVRLSWGSVSAEYVHWPNWLERLFGVTFEDKLERARQKVRSRAEKRKQVELRIYRQMQGRKEQQYNG